MPSVSANTGLDRSPVIYAGRFADQIAGADLPAGCVVLGEQETLPHKLAEALPRADTLVLLDLPSFPLENLTDDHRDVPIVVVLPPGFDAESLVTAFGSALFEHLGSFDRIVAPDPALWEELRRRYNWAESQHIPAASNDASETTRTICALLEAESADSSPHFDKALHRLQAAALEPRFAAAREKRGTKAPLDVLEVGTGAGRWASSFDPQEARFVGIDAREDLVETARANFPDRRFDRLGPDLLLPYEDETFDLVFSVTVMHHYPPQAKRTLLSEMWRVSRPAGRLLFLEDFVFTRRPEKPVIYPMSVKEFVTLILDATAGQVVLEYAESLRYPGEDLRRGGLISLLRLGVLRT